MTKTAPKPQYVASPVEGDPTLPCPGTYRVTVEDQSGDVEADSPAEAFAKYCDARRHWPSPKKVFGANATLGKVELLLPVKGEQPKAIDGGKADENKGGDGKADSTKK